MAGKIAPQVWIALLALILRLFRIGAESLWYDETFTWWVSSLPVPDFFQAIAGDVHPPLWYVVTRLFVAVLGDSEAALRFPSAIFNSAAVVAVYYVARELFQEREARLAMLFAALLPCAGLYYGQEARMYSLLAFLLLVALWAAMRRRWLLYVGAAGLAVYTQNLAVLYVLCMGVATVALDFLRPPSSWELLTSARVRQYRLETVLASMVIFVLWLPWGAVMFRQIGAMSQGFWLWPMFGPGDLLWPYSWLAMGQRLPAWLVLHAYVVATVLFVLGVLLSREYLWRRRGQLLLVATFGAPLLAAVVSLVWQPVFLPRAFICSTFLLCVWWAKALISMSPVNRRVAEVMIGLALLAGVVSHYTVSPNSSDRAGRHDVSGFLEPVRVGWHPGDVMYHANITTAILGGYYTQGLEYRLWPQAGDLNQSLTEETKAAMGFREAEPDELDGFSRAWLVWQTNPMSTMPEQLATMEFLDAHVHRLVGTLYESSMGRVALYEVSLEE